MSTEREKVLFNRKLNRLVNLVRKADKEQEVDLLVSDIDHELFKKMQQVQKELKFVRKDANPELSEELRKLYEEFV